MKVKLVRGICHQCKFWGLLRPRIVPAGRGEAEEKQVCVTCFQTPAGLKSENQMHRRLPEADYIDAGI